MSTTSKEETAELRNQYKEVLGKNPSPAWDAETLKQKIESAGTESQKSATGLEVFNGVEIDPKIYYTFKLKHKSNPRSIMPREAKVWDEETNTTRSIRLCSTEPSPYLDEQNPDSSIDASTVIFTDGEVTISGMDAHKLRFLLAFDGFDRKKAILPNNTHIKDMYKLIDVVKEDKQKLSLVDAKIDAQLIIRKASAKELSNFVRSVYLQPVDSMTPDAIKKYAYEQAQGDPYIVLKEFTDPKHEIKANIQRLFTKGLLSDDNNMVKWTDTNGVITVYGDDERADDVLTKYVLLGDAGAKAFKERMEAKLAE